MEPSTELRRSPPPSGKGKVMTVYIFLLSGLAITGVTTAVLSQVSAISNFVENHFFFTMLIVSLLMTANTTLLDRLSYNEQKASKLMTWAMNCVLAAVPLLYLTAGALVKGSIYTTILAVILTVLSFIVPGCIVELVMKPLSAVHTLVLVCTVYGLLFGSMKNYISRMIISLALWGGFLVYSVLFVCNTQRLFLNSKHPKFDPVFSSFVLYMNVVNMYSRFAAFSAVHRPAAASGSHCETTCK